MTGAATSAHESAARHVGKAAQVRLVAYPLLRLNITSFAIASTLFRLSVPSSRLPVPLSSAQAWAARLAAEFGSAAMSVKRSHSADAGAAGRCKARLEHGAESVG